MAEGNNNNNAMNLGEVLQQLSTQIQHLNVKIGTVVEEQQTLQTQMENMRKKKPRPKGTNTSVQSGGRWLRRVEKLRIGIGMILQQGSLIAFNHWILPSLREMIYTH